MDSPSKNAGAASALASFHGKIKEAIALVRSMTTEDKLKAVQYWNVVSENLQDVVNSSADDISALQSQLSERESMMRLQHARAALPAGTVGAQPSTGPQGVTIIRRTEPDIVGNSDFRHKPAGGGSVSPDLIDHYLAAQSSVGTASDGHVAFSVVVDSYDDFIPGEVFDDPLAGSRADSNLRGGPLGTDESLPPEREKFANCEIDPLSVPHVNFAGDGSQNFGVNVENVVVSTAPERVQNTDEAEDRGGTEHSVNGDLRGQFSPHNNGVHDIVMNFFTKHPRNPGSKGEDSHVYRCSVCQKAYSSVAAFYSHFAIHSERLVCCECGETCLSKSLFRNHMLTHSKTLRCVECEREFTTISNLKRHMKTHTGDRRHECAVCHKRFFERQDLRIHSRLHSGERPYQCSACPARFVQLGALKAHLSSHAGVKPHLCDLCGKTFAQMATLKQHKRRHEGKKGFACDRCPMAFNVRSDMKRHRRSHLSDKPYKCDQCSKSFPRQQALLEHLNRHYGNKPYRCPLCTKGYADMSACKKHIKTHARDESRSSSPSLLVSDHDPPSVVLPVKKCA